MARQIMQLLGISGSLREHSHCTAVLNSLSTLLLGKVALKVHALNAVPLYNADLDGAYPPPPVIHLKEAITECDGLVICSPEYNYGMPGVLKNAIDWASRPGFSSPLKGKPALIMTASPGTAGGVRAQYQIREALSATMARPIARQHVAIAGVQHKIADGRLTDDITIQFIMGAVDDLLAEIALVSSAKRIE